MAVCRDGNVLGNANRFRSSGRAIGWCLLLLAGLVRQSQVTASPPAGLNPAETADAEVLADRPLAVWRFAEPDGGKQAVAERFAHDGNRSLPNDSGQADQLPIADLLASAERLPADRDGTVVFAEPGPRPPRHPAFASDNAAALFGSGRGFLRVSAKTARFDEFQFTAGDSITLEAWVNPFGVADGQQVYIIGKGRTGRSGFAKENQNWSLRLASRGGLARPSFLFREVAERVDSNKHYHRWIASEGFEPGTGWHHVAVSYTFGEKDSLRGYLDGRPVEGKWDAGGATAASPVVDDDEVWIGSSLGGSSASTFAGLLDNVAVHRQTLSPERIAARWKVDETVPAFKPVELAPVPDGRVLFELVEGVPDVNGWGFAPREPAESFTRTSFALTELPQHYNDSGVRADRKLPLVLRARARLVLPSGPQQIRVRTRGEARVLLDGQLLASLKPPGQRTDGHDPMFVPDRSGPAGIRFVQPGDQQAIVEVVGDGNDQLLQVEVKVGRRGRRPELGEFSVSVGSPDAVPTVVEFGSSQQATLLTDAGWSRLADRLATETEAANTTTRRAAAAKQADSWNRRHAEARAVVTATPESTVPTLPANRPDLEAASFNEIDRFINARLVASGIPPAPLLDDAAFVRRLSLDLRGIIPTVPEIEAFLADESPDRRQRLIDRLLADPRWADHWVPYWQDLLAENPNLVNPTLNNTGPFRFWIHESFLDRKPIDRFVTELIMMEGSRYYGGPAGFGLATENDVPMAAKAHIIGRAFLGVEMGCARCHDAPGGQVMQEDLFSLAAMLKRAPEKVPATSSVPVSPERLAQMAITVSLKPGAAVKPAWPFAELLTVESLATAADPADTRVRLAALITSPANPRFARVIANRLWARYLGRGLVDDLDDWAGETPSHPELLDWLARQLVLNDYKVEQVARLIVSSHTYARGPAAGSAGATGSAESLYASRSPRRLTAEQLVDSLAVACGKPFDVEPMNIDVDTSRPPTLSLNLGPVTRAWQFTALGNERDRPSLSLPFAQHQVSLMQAFGWQGERQKPITWRETTPNALQPAIMANGVAVKRASQLSDASGFTTTALRQQPVESFIDELFLRILSRRPTDQEREQSVAIVGPGYDSRLLPLDRVVVHEPEQRPVGVSWSNHVTPEANEAKAELAQIAEQGDPPSGRLAADWRQRAEDLVWTLFNTPEFIFTP
ncbi:MAG: hypothetical protein RLZZ622_814 [Planctomycetota bacterium]